MADLKGIQAWVQDVINRFGVVDGLVNSAGIRGVGQLLDFDSENWDCALDVNLTGTVNTMQAFTQALLQAGRLSSLVNITSMAGIVGVPNLLAYVAFLLSDDASFMTGGIVPEDGGATAGAPSH